MITQGERRVPVQYSKRVVGGRMYGGPVPPIIPLKVNQAGVDSGHFRSSVLTFPLTLAQFIPGIKDFVRPLAGLTAPSGTT